MLHHLKRCNITTGQKNYSAQESIDFNLGFNCLCLVQDRPKACVGSRSQTRYSIEGWPYMIDSHIASGARRATLLIRLTCLSFHSLGGGGQQHGRQHLEKAGKYLQGSPEGGGGLPKRQEALSCSTHKVHTSV